MNELQESIAELRRAGDRLMLSFGAYKAVSRRGAGSIVGFDGVVWDGKKDPIPSKIQDLKSTINVLRCCIHATLPAKSDLDFLSRVLNQCDVDLDAVLKDGRVVLRKGSHRFRFIVEDLVTYVNCLAADPRLKSYEPIGACLNCDGIYMKSRTDQEFCTAGCRSEFWAAKKGKAYFAEKARESRKRRK